MKQVAIFFLAVVCTAISLTSCHTKDFNPQNTDYIMFVNASVESTPLSLKANAKNILPTGISFLGNTPYQLFTGQTDKNTFAIYSSDNSVYTEDYSAGIDLNSAYTLMAIGTSSNPSYLMLNDNTAAPSSGYTKVRIIRPQSDEHSEDIMLGDNLLLSGIGSQLSTDFDSLAAGNYTIKVLDHSNNANVYFSQDGLALQSGTTYTIILSGSPDGTGDAALKATLISNNLPGN